MLEKRLGDLEESKREELFLTCQRTAGVNLLVGNQL